MKTPKATTVTWSSYEFEIYDPDDTNWNKVAGLYIFSGLEKDSRGNPQWLAYYIGETEDFSKRIPNHDKWQEAQLLGATHVHARVETQPAIRQIRERRLIRDYQPPLNVQLKKRT